MPRRLAAALAVGLSACDAASAPPPEELLGTITTVAGTGLAAFDGDGRPATASSLYAPVAVGFDRRGEPLIIDWNNHRVRAMMDNGTLLTMLGTGVEALGPPNVLSIAFSIHHPFDLAEGPGGETFYAGFHDPRVFKVDAGDRVRIVAGIGTPGHAGDEGNAQLALLNEPSGVALSAEGEVYFADSKSHVVRRVDRQELIHAVAGTGARGYSGDGGPAREAALSGPTRIRFDALGRLWICDTDNHVVRRIEADGTMRTVAGTGEPGGAGDGGPATAAELARPIDLALLDDGGVLIADAGNHRIRRVTAEGIIDTLIGTSTSGFSGDGGPATRAALSSPCGVRLGPDGALWISDTENQRVRRVSPTLLRPLAPRP